jgi:signal transduction histidine kinase
LAKVFDPFFTTKDNGTGLGLYAVHRIVDNHGGQVDIRSIQGEGTTIDIRLPFTMPVASIPQ